MIRDLITLESVTVSYKNQPSNVSISMDGQAVALISDLPSHAEYFSRRSSVPPESSGFVPHFATDSVSFVDHKFNVLPASEFDQQLIWHYYEVTISGAVNVSLYLDGDTKIPGKNLQVPFSESFLNRQSTASDPFVVLTPSVVSNTQKIEGFTTDQMSNININDSVSFAPVGAFFTVPSSDAFAGILSGVFVSRKEGNAILLNKPVSTTSTTYISFLKTISLRKSYHTVRVYYPPLSYGYTPHISNVTGDAGYIIKAKPVSLPARFLSKSATMSEGQITYQGTIQVQFYLDGNALGEPYIFKGERNSTGAYKYITKRFYLPSGSTGRVFQWNLVGDYGADGAYGDIAFVETDASLSATDNQPQVPALTGNVQ